MSVTVLKSPGIVRSTGEMGELVVTLPQLELMQNLGTTVVAATNQETFGDAIPAYLTEKTEATANQVAS